MLGPSPLPRSSHKVKAEKTVPRRSEGFTFISTARMLGPDDSKKMQSLHDTTAKA